MLADVIEEPRGGIHSKTTGSPIDHQLYNCMVIQSISESKTFHH